MALGMATTKITITLPDEQLDSIRELVAAGKAASVSAFVKHAVAIGLFDAAGSAQRVRRNHGWSFVGGNRNG
jgi:Arc/MetJ-type ribon-helix-helix transcriptional regulator